MNEPQYHPKYKSSAARSLQMVIDGNRLILQPPHLGLAALLGILFGAQIFLYGLLTAYHPARPRPVETPIKPRIGTSGFHRTSPVNKEKEDVITEAWYLVALKEPW